MTAAAFEVVDATRHQVGESPLWRAAEGALYWVDIGACTVQRWTPADGVVERWRFDEPVACIAGIAQDTSVAGVAPRNGVPGGAHAKAIDAEAGEYTRRFIAGMRSAVAAIELGDDGHGRVDRVAELRHALPAMRANDGRCDARGRFWFGTMHEDMAAAHAVGSLRCLDADVLGPAWFDDLLVQNGLAFAPDGATMYLSDSHPSRRLIWAFDYDLARGVPTHRRVFADLNHHIGRPDGAAIDAEGAYWTCANDGGALLRFAPDGRLDRRVDLPVRKPAMCAFGGTGLDTLFITSIRPADAAPASLDGAVIAIRPGVRGVAEPEYHCSTHHPKAAIAAECARS